MSNRLKIEDLWFERLVTEKEIGQLVQQMALEIRGSYSELPLFLPVLNGSYMFMADLSRALNRPHRIEFIKYQSYTGTQTSGALKGRIGLDPAVVKGQSVLLVEDIVDSGYTVAALRKILKEMGALELRCATAFFKPNALTYGPVPDFIGKEIPNNFVVGYGMDYKGWGRSYPALYTLLHEEEQKNTGQNID